MLTFVQMTGQQIGNREKDIVKKKFVPMGRAFLVKKSKVFAFRCSSNNMYNELKTSVKTVGGVKG